MGANVLNWVYELAGFENHNPCDKFFVKSIVEAWSRVPCKPVGKAEPITPEILGLILQHYGESSNLLDYQICLYADSSPVVFIQEMYGTEKGSARAHHPLFFNFARCRVLHKDDWGRVRSVCVYWHMLAFSAFPHFRALGDLIL